MILLIRYIYITYHWTCQFKTVYGLMTGSFAWISLAALSVDLLYTWSTRDFYVEIIAWFIRRNQHVIFTWKWLRVIYVEINT